LCVVATSIAERRAARIGTSRLLDQEFAGGMIDRVRWAFMGGAAWGDFDEVADESGREDPDDDLLEASA
jgi:hypothetical protein